MNAAGVTEKKAVMELDDMTIRGVMRVYEFVISQLVGEKRNPYHLRYDACSFYKPGNKNDLSRHGKKESFIILSVPVIS